MSIYKREVELKGGEVSTIEVKEPIRGLEFSEGKELRIPHYY